MADFAVYDSKPELREPIVIVGLPGIGGVGKTAADFIADKLGSFRIARIFSPELPAEAKINGGIIEPVCHELRHARAEGKDLLFVLGGSQGTTPQGIFSLSEYEFRIALEYGPALIISLCGYGTEEPSRRPKVIGAASSPELIKRYGGCGIEFRREGPEESIAGAAALFAAFGSAYGIDSVCLMGETSGSAPDRGSAASVVEALSKMVGIEIDVSDLSHRITDEDRSDIQSDGEADPEGISYFG